MVIVRSLIAARINRLLNILGAASTFSDISSIGRFAAISIDICLVAHVQNLQIY